MIKASLALLISLSAGFAQPLVSFKKADSVAALYPRHLLNDLKLLADKLTHPMPTEIEKFRALHTWVCLNISQNFFLYKKNAYRQAHYSGDKLNSWNRKIRVKMFRQLLQSHRTLCTGYAYLLRELATHAGIECVMIDGYGRTGFKPMEIPNHSWNAVRLDGHWYLCDPTWSSGKIDSQGRFVQNYQDSYFLAPPELFARNHFPLDTAWFLIRDKPTFEDFITGPVFFAGFYKYRIQSYWPTQTEIILSKGESITLEYEKHPGYAPNNEMVLFVHDSGSEKFQIETDGTKSWLQYTFTLRGKYQAHILLDGNVAISYQIVVQ